MQNYLNINLIKTSENISPALNPSISFKDAPLPSRDFSNILLEQLNNPKNNLNEMISSNENTVKPAVEERRDYSEKNNLDKPLPGRDLKTNYSNDQAGTDDKSINKDNNPVSDKDIALKSNDAAKYKEKTDNIDNTEEKINNAHARGAKEVKEVKDKAALQKDEKKRADDISSMHKELSVLLNMLNGLLDKKQLQEIKSALQEVKNLLKSGSESKNITRDKSAGASMNGIKNLQIFDLMKKLENLFAQDGRVTKGGAKKSIASGKEKDIEKKAEFPEKLSLKKEITKLTDEIKQLLSEKKSATHVSKNDEISENKNITQRVSPENANTGKNEGTQARDNGQNFNFSFQRKETEAAGNNRSASPAVAGKGGSFSEQLNEIAQNAKVFIRDGDNGTFSIKLHPESLGKVNVNLSLENGVITGKFLVENTDAREALLENMDNVKENLQQSGISVGEFHVNVRGEKNPYDGFNGGISHGVKKAPEMIGTIYEMNSMHNHDGEIDYLI